MRIDRVEPVWGIVARLGRDRHEKGANRLVKGANAC
jgi:hypothetical protein